MKAFLAALQFLTILPQPRSWSTDERDLARSIAFFPVVGLLLGLAIAALDEGLGMVLPRLPAAVLVVAAMLAVSGGLHWDGLTDTADGFFSARSRERMLEIMRDSRSGSMAIAAGVCMLLLKTSLVDALPAASRWGTLVLMVLAGRCALVLHLVALPYARTDGGLASAFCSKRSWWQSLWAVALLGGAAWLLLQANGLVMAASAVTGALLFSAYSYRKIGGFTGDTLGASCEIVELLPALAVVVLGHLKVQLC